ncbi:MAG: T9SS type A sorting domain-containing protein [Crocinitomicaceae bacterium]
MKQFIISLTLFAFSFIGNSQQLEQVLVELKEEGSWKLNQRINHFYDEAGFLSYTINETWSEDNNDWVNVSKLSYTRNKTGKSVENRKENWDQLQGIWVLVNRTTFSLDEKDRVVASTRQEWANNVWEEVQKEYTTYDDQDHVLTKKTYFQNNTQDTVLMINSYHYEYDSEGDIANYLFESPTKKMRSIYTKDDTGKLTRVVKEEFKNDQWEVYSKEEQHYHHAHGLDFTIQKVWFSMTNEWTNNSKSSYLKDANGLIEQNIGYAWTEKDERWNQVSRRTYIYAVQREETTDAKAFIRVYPNPTMKSIHIEHLSQGLITIIDSNGKVVFRKRNTEVNTEINVQSFPEGYYFIRLNDESIGNFVKVN